MKLIILAGRKGMSYFNRHATPPDTALLDCLGEVPPLDQIDATKVCRHRPAKSTYTTCVPPTPVPESSPSIRYQRTSQISHPLDWPSWCLRFSLNSSSGSTINPTRDSTVNRETLRSPSSRPSYRHISAACPRHGLGKGRHVGATRFRQEYQDLAQQAPLG